LLRLIFRVTLPSSPRDSLSGLMLHSTLRRSSCEKRLAKIGKMHSPARADMDIDRKSFCRPFIKGQFKHGGRFKSSGDRARKMALFFSFSRL
jgi:hypothetical protein